MVDWVRRYALPFAVRSGGHSFEGYSSSPFVVIDVRGLQAITFDGGAQTVTVGAGASLGAVYKALRKEGVAFVAGSCPTVGIAGHALGGGYGFLARAYGLACDNIRSLAVVDARANFIVASPAANADLFWASQGGGGGSLWHCDGIYFCHAPGGARCHFSRGLVIAKGARPTHY